MLVLRYVVCCALLFAVAGSAVSAGTKPAATPGGANQITAINGKIGDTLWNGQIRFKVVEVREATAADHPESVVPLPTQKVMVVTTIIRNGTPGTWANLVSYQFADKDDITFDIPGHLFTPVSLSIAQAGAARQTALVPIDKNFVPVKLIFTCATCGPKFKPFRVTIPPTAQ